MTTESKAVRLNVGDVGTCPTTGKRMYLTRAAAKRKKRMLGDPKLSAFRCTTCNHFHLGHRGNYTRAEHRALHNPNPQEEVTPMHTTPPDDARERCPSCGAFISPEFHCRCS